MRILVAALAAVILAGCTDPGPVTRDRIRVSSPTHEIADLVAERYSGDRARETVAFMDQFVRWPGNRGFDASIHRVVEGLQAAGYVHEDSAGGSDLLTYRVERYPMDQPAWEPAQASLRIVGQPEPVLTLETNRNMLARNSHSGAVEAELVDVGDSDPVDCTAARGRIVLADRNAGRVFAQAVRECGALGVLGYSLPDYLQPEKNTRSIQFSGIPYSDDPGWAISLSHDARARLKAALAAGPVRVRVETEVVWTPGADELTVVADLRGRSRPEERFVFSAHVQEPGANDNASGVGAQLEMARVAAELVRENAVTPERSITFLWGLEIRSTARYIARAGGRHQVGALSRHGR